MLPKTFNIIKTAVAETACIMRTGDHGGLSYELNRALWSASVDYLSVEGVSDAALKSACLSVGRSYAETWAALYLACLDEPLSVFAPVPTPKQFSRTLDAIRRNRR